MHGIYLTWYPNNGEKTRTQNGDALKINPIKALETPRSPACMWQVRVPSFCGRYSQLYQYYLCWKEWSENRRFCTNHQICQPTAAKSRHTSGIPMRRQFYFTVRQCADLDLDTSQHNLSVNVSFHLAELPPPASHHCTWLWLVISLHRKSVN